MAKVKKLGITTIVVSEGGHRAEHQEKFMQALKNVSTEFIRAKSKHVRYFASTHEGQGVLEEEVLELRDEMYWGEKKWNNEELHKQAIYTEAKQVAAMAIRIMVELG